jgi:hypothetical protein
VVRRFTTALVASPFCTPPGAAELIQIAQACCRQVIRSTAHHHDDEVVHVARQAIKRARAILRWLEKAGLSRARARRRELARCMRQLSRRRDAVVTVQLARRLARKVRGSTRAAALALAVMPVPRQSQSWWKLWRQSVDRAAERLSRLPRRGPDARALSACLSHSYRRACRWARKVRRHDHVASAHEWRKTAVVWREQLLLAQPLGPTALTGLHDHLHQLTHRLGQAVDCQVLLVTLAGRRWLKIPDRASRKLATLARHRQKHALKRARRLWEKIETDWHRVGRHTRSTAA